MESFDSFGLKKEILENLKKLNHIKPTPIQVQAIKPAIAGKDILGSAHTGTGKTAAFGIPLIQKLMVNKELSSLVLTPTRELAIQVVNNLTDIISRNIKIKTGLIIGGDSMRKQLHYLKNFSPRIIVGTPGRINDHLLRGSLKLNKTGYLVLDETDRMLDMGFSDQIEKIMKYLPKVRQTLLFSATIPKNIKDISYKYLFKPVNISVDEQSTLLKKIKHTVIHLKQKEKYEKLINELNHREGSIIVFMKTKFSSKRMAIKLEKNGMSVNAIHGDLRQNQREIVLTKFRKKKYKILIATDIAARGLDISHIEHVINYDLPQRADDYIHRIGRTARAGMHGEAVCFVNESDDKMWSAIHRILDPNKKNIKRENTKKKFNKEKSIKENKRFRPRKNRANVKKKRLFKKLKK